MTKFLGKEFYVDSSSKFVDKVEFDSSTYFNSLASYDPNNIPILQNPAEIVYRGYVDSSVADIYTILNKLVPEQPDDLSTKNLSNPGYYSARIESNGTQVSNITDDNTPISTVSDFLKEIDTNLIAYINGSSDGSIHVIDSDMSGFSNQSLTITDDVDAYAGQSGKENFYRILDAQILSDTSLDASTLQQTYNLQYPDSGNETGTVNFYIDDPTNPSISQQSLDSSVATITRYISGVPSYADGDSIGISYRVDNAIGKFYHSTTLGNANLNAGDSVNSGLPGTPPSEGDNVSFSSQTLTFGNNEYYENGNISINITPYNSKGSYTSGDGTLAISGRIDTVSNENDRVLSGYGDYPTSGYGGTFDSSVSLKTVPYDSELQKLNGLYRWPTGDYSGWRDGPNYNTGLDASTRWVTFSTTITDVTGFNIQFNNTTNFTANDSEVTANIKIFANVDGGSPTNGWIDCNEPYDGVDSDVTDDGEGAMEVNNSSATYKSCTFGSTLKSGTLYVRVGLEQGSSLLFEDVTITT